VPVLGIDVTPGGGFAYVVLENNIVVERGVTDVRGLINLFKKYRCETLAVDSVSELFQHGRPLIKALGKLPYVVNVVEVTRGVELKSTEDLVREHFGVDKGRLDPLETAFYLAMLAQRGVGTPVKLFEEETVILIHRRISTTPGGMSRNRYMRNVTHRIKTLMARIEARLKEAKLDYDLFVKEESGEVSSAKFVVYANREVVRRYVKPMRSIDVAVSIFSLPAKRSEGAHTSRYLIIGVDPGVVTGLAILTLDGEVLDTVARRSFSRGELTRYVQQWGIPILVATDVGDPPEYVKRLAAMVGAVLYTPGRDLSTEEKAEIVERIGWQVKTTHERDALAAAYRAYLEYKPKFERIEKEFGSILKPEQMAYAKALVIRGYSIAQAVSEALKRREKEETKVVYITVEKPCSSENEKLSSLVKALQYENQQLQREIEELRRENAALRRAVEDEKWKDVKYREMQMRIEQLLRTLGEKEAEINYLKRAFVEILMNRERYKLVHKTELSECRGGEYAGTICKNFESLEEAVVRKSLGVPLKEVVKLDLGEFYVVDMDKVAELVAEIKRRLDERKGVDLKKIVEEYRRGLI